MYNFFHRFYLFFTFLLLPFTAKALQPISQSALNQSFEKNVRIDAEKQNLIGYLSIEKDRAIDQSTFLEVKYALEEYVKRGVVLVILRLDTPGGQVLPSLKISDLLLKLDQQNGIPVIAFIDNWAISAGAMLAYSCRYIAITDTASMGAAAPVIMGQSGEMLPADEKINSTLRAEMTNLARSYDRNPLLAEAMVDKDLILVIENGELIELPNESLLDKMSADQIVTRKGKLLTLNAKELIDYGVADFVAGGEALAPITEKELSQQRWPAAKSPLFQQPFLASIPNAEIISYSNWKVGFFSFLSHPVIASLLFMGLILGAYFELSTPGFGALGVLSIVCLSLILLTSFAQEAINWLEIILLITGVVLLLIELFVLPGFGIAGVLGIALVLIGLFTLMLPGLGPLELPTFADKWEVISREVLPRFGYLAVSLLLAFVLIGLLAHRITKKSGLFSRLVLQSEQLSSEGYVAGYEKDKLPPLHTEGIAYSSLRPSGKVTIDDEIFDCIAQGEFIMQGERVEVISHEGNRVIVTKKI